MREPSVQHMIRWIVRRYEMSTSNLARMFQTDRQTVCAWLREGRILPHYESKIRSSYYFLNGRADPRPRSDARIPVDMFAP
jgi:hypothetical protein